MLLFDNRVKHLKKGKRSRIETNVAETRDIIYIIESVARNSTSGSAVFTTK